MKVFPILALILVFSLVYQPALLAKHEATWWVQAKKDAQAQGYLVATVEEVQSMTAAVGNLLIVDVRPDYEYELGHLPGALNLEFHLGDRLQLTEQKKNELTRLLGEDPDRPVVIYCRSYS